MANHEHGQCFSSSLSSERDQLLSNDPNRRNVLASFTGSSLRASRSSTHACSATAACVIALSFAACILVRSLLDRPHLARHAANGPIHSQGSFQDIVAQTLLISIDGFRPEYLSRTQKAANGSSMLLAPNLYQLAVTGSYAKHGMQPVVPTETKPNHWSLATGLFPESSGIIRNQMYDPTVGVWFGDTRSRREWYNGSPIWHTLRNTLRTVLDPKGNQVVLSENYTTACIFWPGSEVEELSANIVWNYDSKISYEARVHRAVSLLKGEASDCETPPQFVTLYFKDVDVMGHRHGPNSYQVNFEIQRVDRAIGLLLEELGERVVEKYNIVIVSDHGMTEMSPKRTVELGAPSDKLLAIALSPLGLFMNLSVPAEEIYRSVKASQQKQGNRAFTYLKEDLPERWHLKRSPLVPQVATMTDLGWQMVYPNEKYKSRISHNDYAYHPEFAQKKRTFLKGNHGFDNTFEDMQAIFLAQGPAFIPGTQVTGMRSVDLYEMLCFMFRAEPAPNNGSLQITLSSILKA